ncbi:hypothetical protein JYT51_01575 [Candidatus Amoebophilus asiaticus]|nr:hypothetical protein [Candidatus Amoebophilus asiaticus]
MELVPGKKFKVLKEDAKLINYTAKYTTYPIERVVVDYIENEIKLEKGDVITFLNNYFPPGPGDTFPIPNFRCEKGQGEFWPNSMWDAKLVPDGYLEEFLEPS